MASRKPPVVGSSPPAPGTMPTERPPGNSDDPTQAALRAQAAAAITTALTGDLRHPKRPRVPIVLPAFNTAGHNDPRIVDGIQQTAALVGEALIHTVLGQLGAELIATTELADLRRRAANAKPHTVDVTCRHGPLITLAVKPDTTAARVDCRRLHNTLTRHQEQ
jgi:hypothetical protein